MSGSAFGRGPYGRGPYSGTLPENAAAVAITGMVLGAGSTNAVVSAGAVVVNSMTLGAGATSPFQEAGAAVVNANMVSVAFERLLAPSGAAVVNAQGLAAAPTVDMISAEAVDGSRSVAAFAGQLDVNGWIAITSKSAIAIGADVEVDYKPWQAIGGQTLIVIQGGEILWGKIPVPSCGVWPFLAQSACYLALPNSAGDMFPEAPNLGYGRGGFGQLAYGTPPRVPPTTWAPASTARPAAWVPA